MSNMRLGLLLLSLILLPLALNSKNEEMLPEDYFSASLTSYKEVSLVLDSFTVNIDNKDRYHFIRAYSGGAEVTIKFSNIRTIEVLENPENFVPWQSVHKVKITTIRNSPIEVDMQVTPFIGKTYDGQVVRVFSPVLKKIELVNKRYLENLNSNGYNF